MSRSGLLVLLLSVIGGYFGLGTVAGSAVTAAAALLGVFVAVFLFTLIHDTGSRWRWPA